MTGLDPDVIANLVYEPECLLGPVPATDRVEHDCDFNTFEHACFLFIGAVAVWIRLEKVVNRLEAVEWRACCVDIQQQTIDAWSRGQEESLQRTHKCRSRHIALQVMLILRRIKRFVTASELIVGLIARMLGQKSIETTQQDSRRTSSDSNSGWNMEELSDWLSRVDNLLERDVDLIDHDCFTAFVVVWNLVE